MQNFDAKQLVFGKEVPIEKGTAFLGDRTISFIGVKYSFQNLSVWSIYESQNKKKIMFSLCDLRHHADGIQSGHGL